MTTNLKGTWCECKNQMEIVETQGPVFKDDGECTCGIHKHHYHCPVCGCLTQIG